MNATGLLGWDLVPAAWRDDLNAAANLFWLDEKRESSDIARVHQYNRANNTHSLNPSLPTGTLNCIVEEVGIASLLAMHART